jgi:hypothetical protein
MSRALILGCFLLAIPLVFLFLKTENSFVVSVDPVSPSSNPGVSLSVPETPPLPAPPTVPKSSDIEKQEPLVNPPALVKAVYLTSWSAAAPSKLNYLIDLIKKTELNAAVIDIKDYSGYVAYDIKNIEVEKYGAKQIRIPKINFLIKRLHDQGIYVIGRLTVFQDPVLAKARPDLAVKDSATAKTWLDRKGLAWIDPAAKEAWDYNIAIAKDALERGFDEINFDYIRFPSDGDLSRMVFPFYDSQTSKSETIKEFFKYLRGETIGSKISADFFGLSTVRNDDMGIGQIIEDAYAYFDFVCPMVYPSHYASGFLGYKNPAQYPYEVVGYSMKGAAGRLKNYLGKQEVTGEEEPEAGGEKQAAGARGQAKLRPWLQDFDLGANYDALMVRAEIKAVEENSADGWMLWNPENSYTGQALNPEN